MRKITYQQAAEMLGVKYITIRHAVADKRLTRCASNTKTAMLLEDQVNLFIGKRGITNQALSLEEAELWHQYKKIAENPELLEKSNHISMTSEEVNSQIAEAYQNGENDALKKLAKHLVNELKPFFKEEPSLNPS